MLALPMFPTGAAPPEAEEQAADHHRARALAAMTAAVGENGYAATTVADVLACASMSRRTFYRLFANREECFLAAYDLVRDEAIGLFRPRAAATGREWAEHVEDALSRLLGYLADHPDRARLLMVEPVSAGTAGLERHERTMGDLARRLSRSHPRADGHGLVLEAAVGALHRVLHARIVQGRARQLPYLAAELAATIARLVDAAPPTA
jgi:AcrR family transcriptional regulator